MEMNKQEKYKEGLRVLGGGRVGASQDFIWNNYKKQENVWIKFEKYEETLTFAVARGGGVLHKTWNQRITESQMSTELTKKN